MKLKNILILILSLSAINLSAMKSNDHVNGDTLVLKGRIVKEDMENKKGQKMEGMQDLYFSSGTNSYFIKLAGGKFLRSDLEKYGNKEITIRAVKKFGNVDIDSDDPSYAQTRVGEYIVILEIIE